MELVFMVMMGALAAFAACMARTVWCYGQLFLFEWQISKRQHEIDCLEHEIVKAQFACAAANPEAASILMGKEALRKLSPSHPDYQHSRRLWTAELGGEPVDVSTNCEEEEPSCVTAD